MRRRRYRTTDKPAEMGCLTAIAIVLGTWAVCIIAVLIAIELH
jgi:hypothetical protein